MSELDLQMKIERLTLALEHAKKEFYYRGRRDILFEIMTEEAVDLEQLYAEAVEDLKNFPELKLLPSLDTQH